MHNYTRCRGSRLAPLAAIIIATFAACIALFVGACGGGGGGGDDETPTIPTIDAAAEQTQVAVNTEEAGALATATRAPGPAEQPTLSDGTVRLATTNGPVASGLLDVLLPMFETESGYTVDFVTVADAPPELGSAIAAASLGFADVVLANSPEAEMTLVADGDGIERALVMHTDFIIVGPDQDPALVRDEERADDALRAIYDGQHGFITTIDGTDVRAHELRIWQGLGLLPEGAWYQSSGEAVDGTLAAANERQAYAIADRAAFLRAGEANSLEILLAGDPAQIDAYHVIVVNLDVHPAVNTVGARAFAAFLVRPDVQQVIGEFGLERFGEPLFTPDAGKPQPTP